MVMKYTRNGSIIGTSFLNNGSGIRDLSRAHTDVQSLFSFTSFTFTNAGAAGAQGPTAANTSAAYAGQVWLGTAFFSTTAGMQYFTIPDSGSYTISAAGAMGGNSYQWGILGGNGAIVTATFGLQKGDTIKMAVGQMGEGNSSVGLYNGGGGGGTFVCYTNNSPILIAGGGGGSTWASSSYRSAEIDGRVTGLTAGANTVGGRGGQQTSYLNYPGFYTGVSGQIPGAINGNGGYDGLGAFGANTIVIGSIVQAPAGGGGLLGAGGYNVYNYTTQGQPAEGGVGGQSFIAGAVGGQKNGNIYSGDGGFGGGGSGEYYNYVGGGGGGGYSGGNGGYNYNYSAGGGSSYVATGGTSISSAQTRQNHGYVTITKN